MKRKITEEEYAHIAVNNKKALEYQHLDKDRIILDFYKTYGIVLYNIPEKFKYVEYDSKKVYAHCLLIYYAKYPQEAFINLSVKYIEEILNTENYSPEKYSIIVLEKFRQADRSLPTKHIHIIALEVNKK